MRKNETLKKIVFKRNVFNFPFLLDTGSLTIFHRLVQDSWAKVIFPPQPPEWWDFRYIPWC